MALAVSEANAILDSIAASTVYLALATAAQVTLDGTVNGEVTGGGYVRIAMPFNAAAAAAKTNSGIVDFGVATTNWGTITNFAICSGVSGNNALAYGALGSSITVNSGQSAQVRAGQISLTLA